MIFLLNKIEIDQRLISLVKKSDLEEKKKMDEAINNFSFLVDDIDPYNYPILKKRR